MDSQTNRLPRIENGTVYYDVFRVHPLILVKSYARAHANLNDWDSASGKFHSYWKKLLAGVGHAVESGELQIRDLDTGLVEQPAKLMDLSSRAVADLQEFCDWANAKGLFGCPKDAAVLARFLGLTLGVPLEQAPPEVHRRLARRQASKVAEPSTSTSTGGESGESRVKDDRRARLRIQQEAAEEWIRWLANNGNPTVHAICEPLAKWCSDNGVKTPGGVSPKAGTLRNSILGAGHWTPPAMTREEAKTHVARLAQVAQGQPAQVAQAKS